MHTRRLASLLTVAIATFAFAKSPPDTLSGPPFVTAKAWAVMDARTGEILHGRNADTPAKAASTTKVMCAYVILTLAGKEPAVMDEVVTFSKFADDTGGSTSDIRVGEKVTVAECLYGLLLPSGNDAGNALAEHFNARFAPPGPDTPTTQPSTPRANFVAEMNRTARRLGLKDTVYRIPYGDGGSPTDMTTTPRDLLTLARAAMQLPAYRKYCSTQKHTGTVTQPDGSPRSIEWTNTNRLLGTDGYDGVKTGSTNQAGSCLVTSNHRGDHHLLTCVLGSTSDDGRYVDTQNLVRYAYLQLGEKPK